MFAIFSSGTELRRFTKGVMPKLAIGILLFIPLLYGALYLWAFWAPNEHMDRLDIALVNEDTGADNDGERVTAGQEVVDELLDGKDLGWHLTDAEDAATGVADGTYYFSVTLPADFSEAVVSPSGDDPTSAKIVIDYNDANSFLASTLGKSAMQQLRTAVAQKIGDEQITTVLNGVQDASDGFATAADGADQLKTGAGQLAEGAGVLKDGGASMTVGLDDLLDGMDQLSSGAKSLTSGTSQLADGADTLTDGLGDASDGAKSLASGTSQLASGGQTLSAGLDQLETAITEDGGLADGTSQLAAGLKQLKAAINGDGGLSEGTKTLAAGASDVAAGSSQVESGIDTLINTVADNSGHMADALNHVDTSTLDPTSKAYLEGVIDGLNQVKKDLKTEPTAEVAQLTGGAQQVADGASQVSAGASALDIAVNDGSGDTPSLKASVKQLSAGASALDTAVNDGSDGTPSLVASVAQLASGGSTLSSGLADANEGASSLSSGVTKLESGSKTLANGLDDAHSGAKKIASGLGTAKSGTSQLADGSEQITDGAAQLEDGGEQLEDGSDTLSSKLTDASQQANIGDQVKINQTATTLSEPVELDETYLHEAEGFGEGFAPFFISLALFVGGIITWLLLHALPRRALAAGVGGIRSVMAGFLPAAAFGLGQVLIMMAVLFVGLHLQANYVLGTILFTFFAALTFFAMQQMFIITLGGAAGRVVSLALLMFQLSSSGGTYPVPTTPQFFQDISPWMPMTYVVTGLRHLITGSVDHRFWLSFVVLLGVLIGCLAISTIAASRQRVWSIARLHPEIEL